MAHLTAAQIASDLQISRAQAYRLLREMLPLVIGRSVRVSATAYAAWTGCAVCCRCT